MKKFASLLCAVGAIVSAHATTVIPPTFGQLVSQAEEIFQGSVTSVRSQWVGEGAQRYIVSYVTFQVEDALKGEVGRSYTIRMMGGTVEGETMGVSDAPVFAVGDHEIVFVQNNGSQFVPIVGIMHGRFHLQKDQTGQDVVLKHDHSPLNNVSEVGSEKNTQAEKAMTAQNFKAAIRQAATSESSAAQQ